MGVGLRREKARTPQTRKLCDLAAEVTLISPWQPLWAGGGARVLCKGDMEGTGTDPGGNGPRQRDIGIDVGVPRNPWGEEDIMTDPGENTKTDPGGPLKLRPLDSPEPGEVQEQPGTDLSDLEIGSPWPPHTSGNLWAVSLRGGGWGGWGLLSFPMFPRTPVSPSCGGGGVRQEGPWGEAVLRSLGVLVPPPPQPVAAL